MHRWSSFWPASVAFGYPNFRLFLSARFLIICATEMQAVAVAWQVYGLTHRPLDLGLVGLAQFLPGLFLFLAAGHAADRFRRERIVIACAGAWSVSALLLAGLTWFGLHSVYPIYMVLLLNGVIRAFNGPAGQALLPQVVPAEHFQNAIAWHASVFQTATILGPMVGGLLYAVAGSPVPVYCVAAIGYVAGLLLTWAIRLQRAERRPLGASVEILLEGIRYIWRSKLVLGVISLDLFAVLLGGAVALLPVYARDILKVGASGLGLLRSAPGLGAVIMAIVVAHWPLRRQAGARMLACIFGFGVFTVVFGISRNLVVSLFALVLLGALDMVSVIVRQTMVQLATPDEMRGRVSAVNSVFIGASNEVGQFESGITAQWFGTVPAVVLGGIGTMLIVLIWMRLFPSLRRIHDLSAPPS